MAEAYPDDWDSVGIDRTHEILERSPHHPAYREDGLAALPEMPEQGGNARQRMRLPSHI